MKFLWEVEEDTVIIHQSYDRLPLLPFSIHCHRYRSSFLTAPSSMVFPICCVGFVQSPVSAGSMDFFTTTTHLERIELSEPSYWMFDRMFEDFVPVHLVWLEVNFPKLFDDDHLMCTKVSL
ncbi:hypothetical protein L2E82_16451 [Cichorium intybus]|uniref:Uncharacterized protein n=1 Tax=Cichorium intybus TaxID=13427 RepID=A0ACB9F584_CICIN|nr:hypothetical protein L2E82_16451 [Cichorium intybus]